MLGQAQKAVELADRAVLLNPGYPDWYNQALRCAYFFGKQFEQSVKYAKLVKEPFALDYAYQAMSLAYLGKPEEATKAADEVRRLDPQWIAEQYLSDTGGASDAEAELFVEAARKAGLAACVKTEALSKMPALIHVKSCDNERLKSAAG